jgi:nicotinamide riboside kinase
MRLYLVGAHNSGKTTLARYIGRRYSLPIVTEVARQVLAEMELTLEQLRTDNEKVDQYQKAVLTRQIAAERNHAGSFVSDRAFDNLAYAAEHSTITSEVFASAELVDYMTWVAGGLVLFVRPHRHLLRDDGVREKGDWDAVVRIDGMIKLLLEQFGVPYLPIASSSHQERIRAIEFVMKLACQ